MELGDAKTGKYLREFIDSLPEIQQELKTTLDSLPESEKIEFEFVLSAIAEHSRLVHLLERNIHAQLDSEYDGVLFREMNKLSELPIQEYWKQLRLSLNRLIEDLRKECVEKGLIDASESRESD